MIEYLRMRGIGVISEADIDLAGGFTALTGETGAGKTIVLSALGMLLGAKPRVGLATAPDSRVEGGWRMASGHPMVRKCAEIGATVEDDSLIISRTLPPAGRGRSAVGGLGIPVSKLAELTEGLVTVHGQTDQLLLRRASAQREVLDRFGGAATASALAEYRRLYPELVSIDRHLAASDGRADELRDELAWIMEGLEAIEAVDPAVGEEAELHVEIGRLSQADELREAVCSAAQALLRDDGAPDVRSVIAHATRSLLSAGTRDGVLDEMATRLAEALAIVDDVAAGAARYVDELDADPGRLERCQERLALISALTRRYGPDIESVLAWGKRANARLVEVEHALDVDELRRRFARVRQAVEIAATRLREARVEAGEALARAVTRELQAIAMPRAELVVEVLDGDLGPDGADVIRFLLRAHPGADAVPVGAAASGGELSRIMLALEVVLATEESAVTYVFDEVDAGVGGQAAMEIGRRLAALAKRSQVIVVTHLAQVAAFADDHLVVEKTSQGSVTTATVRRVSGDEREREIARMLSGQSDSRHALAHAKELVELAGRSPLVT